jgi:uncharacterized protein (TIGR02646 family)
MKYIEKGKEPIEFTNWKKKKNSKWTPSFGDLSGKEKLAVLNALKREQGFICCYCERSLESIDSHIEHFVPQNKDIDALDFSNMLCSCQNRLRKGDPRHCGNSKNGWFEESKIISPFNSTCEKKFKYTFDGRILPSRKNDIGAVTTIDKLQLKIDKLKDLRSKAIEPFVDPELTENERKRFVKSYLKGKNNNNGKFNEFYTTIKFLFA